MNKNVIEQPPTYIPPPQHYYQAPQPSPQDTHGPSQEKAAGRKFKAAFYATVAFIALSNIVVYRLVNQVFLAFTGKANEIVSEMGLPTTKGIFLHSFVFFLAVMVLFRGL